MEHVEDCHLLSNNSGNQKTPKEKVETQIRSKEKTENSSNRVPEIVEILSDDEIISVKESEAFKPKKKAGPASRIRRSTKTAQNTKSGSTSQNHNSSRQELIQNTGKPVSSQNSGPVKTNQKQNIQNPESRSDFQNQKASTVDSSTLITPQGSILKTQYDILSRIREPLSQDSLPELRSTRSKTNIEKPLHTGSYLVNFTGTGARIEKPVRASFKVQKPVPNKPYFVKSVLSIEKPEHTNSPDNKSDRTGPYFVKSVLSGASIEKPENSDSQIQKPVHAGARTKEASSSRNTRSRNSISKSSENSELIAIEESTEPTVSHLTEATGNRSTGATVSSSRNTKSRNSNSKSSKTSESISNEGCTNVTVKCGSCGRGFSDYVELMEHLQLEHMDKSKKGARQQDKVFKTLLCLVRD